MKWPDARLLDLFGVELPIILAPMANFAGVEMAIAVAEADGLGSLPCAALNPDQIRAGVAEFRLRSRKPLNLNFFCHALVREDLPREQAWLDRIAPYYAEFDAEPPALPLPAGHPPFGEAHCAAVEELRPEIVSFHFGLPPSSLLKRVKATGCKVISSATTLREARFLAKHGVDAIITQGAEAGGHRGMFLETDVATQIGTFALVRAISESLKVPVIAAGGIADSKGIAATFALGASAVQIGTAYLICPESTISDAHRQALADPDRETIITNVLTGRPRAESSIVSYANKVRLIRERQISRGPDLQLCPSGQAEAKGSTDFSPLWSGQAAKLPSAMGAADLTRMLARDAQG
jgi:nitronate monooxygenase